MRRWPTRWLAAAATAGATAWLLPRLVPLASEDPFRLTLAWLPLVVALLTAIGAAGRRRGARRRPPLLVRFEAVALGALVLLLAARAHLDLAMADELLAAAFALLLASHVVSQLLALRPLLGRRLPQRPSALFFLLPLTVYLAILPYATTQRPPDGDEPWYLLVAHSLAFDFDTDLSNNYAQGDSERFVDRQLSAQPGDPVGPDGEQYSRHNALLPLLLAVPYRLAGKHGALAMMALLAAALAWTTLRLGARYAPQRPGEVLAAYGLLAFAPPLLLYSHQVWVEVPAALAAMLALDRIHALRQRRRAGDDEPPGAIWDWLAIGLLLLLLPLLKIRFLLLTAPLALLAWWHGGRPRWAGIGLGLLLVAAAAGILLFNQQHFGNPLKVHSWQEMELFDHPLMRFALGGTGLFWDAAFGLFAVAPLWLLLLAALPLLARRRSLQLADLLLFAAPYLAIVMPRSEWYGGWSPPFRYALVALPLLALALVPLLAQRRRPGARWLLAALAALTLALTLLWVAVPGWTYNLADGRTHLLDLAGRRLEADVARLFPSMVRPRAATWIWPVATLLLVPLAWWWPRRGRRPGWRGTALPAGVAALLLAGAAVPLLARQLPTRVVQLEDAYVVHDGGHLYPERWVNERSRFRGSWVLREGDRLTAPVVAGGERAEMMIYAHLTLHDPAPFTLELLADGELLARAPVTITDRWVAVPLGEVRWPPQARHLTVRVPPPQHPGRPNGVNLDRLEIDWR